MNHSRYRLLETPTGPFALIEDEAGTFSTTWVDASSEPWLGTMKQDETLLDDLAERLERYFDGEDVDFSDVPTPVSTPFRRRCWEACREIPRGQTLSYGALAAAAGGGPGAARAAGQAMRHNPLPIIVPCHRVVASNGGLGGFAGSSDTNGTALGHKRYLLAMEGAAVSGLAAAV